MAVEIEDSIQQRLAALQRRLASQLDGVRWPKPEQIHLTLKFLGEVAESQLAELTHAVQRVAEASRPFEFAIRQVGCFPPRGPARIVWAGVAEPSGALAACQSACESALEPLGFARESRPYHPHLTIGRVKEGRGFADIRQRIAQFEQFEGGLQPAHELTLFESRLSPHGPSHFVLSRSALIGEPPSGGG